MSDREPPPEGIEEPADEAAAETAAWEAIVALLAAAGVAVIVDNIVNLDLWPFEAWDPTETLERIGASYATQWTQAPDLPSTPAVDNVIAADDAGTRAREWIAQRENQLVRAGDGVFEQVRSKVDQALSDGASEDDLVTLIRDITNPDTTLVDWRARSQRIARTEIHSAEQAGQEAFTDQLVNAGAIDPPRFAWLDAGDTRVRPGPDGVGPFSHRNVRPITWPEAFNVSGELLKFPGDPTGSPGNILNCRCTKIRI